jgi:hypothetical protein
MDKWASYLHAPTPRFEDKGIDGLGELEQGTPGLAPLTVTRLWTLCGKQTPEPGTILIQRVACTKTSLVHGVIPMPAILTVLVDGVLPAVAYERAKVFSGGVQAARASAASGRRADAFVYNGVSYRPTEWAHVWLSLVANVIMTMQEFETTYAVWREGIALTIPCMPAKCIGSAKLALTAVQICTAIDHLSSSRADARERLAIRCPPIELALAAAFLARAERREWRVIARV